jgi:hypothetical protein
MVKSQKDLKQPNGGDSRELNYRAIVERHVGKHTGLRHSTKACPQGHEVW